MELKIPSAIVQLTPRPESSAAFEMIYPNLVWFSTYDPIGANFDQHT